MTERNFATHIPSEEDFKDSPISRRDFVRLSAATTGVLALPGAASAEYSSSKTTKEYEYILNHTPESETIQTLIKFSDESGFDELSDLDTEVTTTTEPSVAAYAQLTSAQAENAADLSSVTELLFSPGANPFWRLGEYSDRVFPAVSESADFIDYEEMIAGLNHLQENNPDRLQFSSIGQSPGYFNFISQEEDPKGVRVAEITNDVSDEESFQEKEKVAYSLSIHGDERAGAEAGTRFIEDLLDGNESTVESLLDDVVLVFFYPNPDGWVARHPQYNDEGEGFQRASAGVEDPNRSYPTVGWIDSTHYPAESNGSNLEDDDPGIDTDVASRYTEKVPDSLAIVEHFRGYSNLNYGTDLHGKGPSEDFTEGLIINDQFTYEELHSMYELNNTIDERHDEALESSLDDIADVYEQINEAYNEESEEEVKIPAPTSTYDYGTVYDTLEYSTTGILVSWMAQPEEQGGLGMIAQAHEVTVFGDEFMPELVELQVISYMTVIRTFAEHAVENIEATLDTKGQSTAVVTADSLTRSSEQLEFVQQSELEISEAGEGSFLTGSVLDETEAGTRSVATPNPGALLVYDQRDYETTPFVFFNDTNDYAVGGGEFSEITVDEVRAGALLEGDDDRLAYDNLVVIHDSKVGDRQYTDAIDAFVEEGGNLVATDSGVQLLGHLENDLASTISTDDVTSETRTFAVFEEDNYPSRLLEGTRPYQDELWKLSPIGYAITEDGEAPVTFVDTDAFTSTGGEVAATTGEMVAAGSILPDDSENGIHVIGSLLPPASQVHLHPFGMVNYTVSFFGSLVLTNALGYRQHRYVNDELVRSFGPGAEGGATYYQIDFVVGDPIQNLRGPEGTYTNDQLIRFAHGSTNKPIIRRSEGEFTTDETIADRVESQAITIEGGTAKIAFTIAEGESVTLTLASYEKIGPGWSPETESKQEFIDAETRTFESGTHTLTVDLPDKPDTDD